MTVLSDESDDFDPFQHLDLSYELEDFDPSQEIEPDSYDTFLWWAFVDFVSVHLGKAPDEQSLTAEEIKAFPMVPIEFVRWLIFSEKPKFCGMGYLSRVLALSHEAEITKGGIDLSSGIERANREACAIHFISLLNQAHKQLRSKIWTENSFEFAMNLGVAFEAWFASGGDDATFRARQAGSHGKKIQMATIEARNRIKRAKWKEMASHLSDSMSKEAKAKVIARRLTSEPSFHASARTIRRWI